MGNFKNLRVWNDGMQLAESVYTAIRISQTFTQDFGLANRLVYIDAETLVTIENLSEKIRAALKNLIKARSYANDLKADG